MSETQPVPENDGKLIFGVDNLRPRVAAWCRLIAEFDVTEHLQLANTDTNQIFPECVRHYFDARASYIKTNMKGVDLISYSVPTALSAMSNRNVVPVLCIFHGSHEVAQRTVQSLFCNIQGLTTNWTFNEHAMFIRFLRESSLGGMDPTLMFWVDYMGVCDDNKQL